MKLGCFSILYNEKPLEEVLKIFSELGMEAIELGVGGYSKSSHVDVDGILADPRKGKDLLKLISDYGLSISALSTHGNPVHPDPEKAAQFHNEFIDACKIAEILGVDRLLLSSGCPGGAPGDKTPNWITCPWPDDFLQARSYQWDEVLIPYWSEAVSAAARYGVNKLAIEMHPGFSVYNVETLQKLRNAVGDAICCNFDPSHLLWQGVDPAQSILKLGQAIVHVHAKDVYVNRPYIEVNGNLDAKHYADIQNRSWTFRTVGYGSDEKVWKDMISAFAAIGYDGVISVEHEDVLMSKDEGLGKAVRFLKNILITEKSSGMWWA